MFFKKLIHDLLMVFSFVVLLASGLMGIFAGTEVCAAIWGENILHTALGSPPDHFHPAFWTFMLITLPGVMIGLLGGASLCVLLQSYAKWYKGERSKPDFWAWFQNFSREP